MKFQRHFNVILKNHLGRDSCILVTQNDRLPSPVSLKTFLRSRWIEAERTGPHWLLVRHPISKRTGKWVAVGNRMLLTRGRRARSLVERVQSENPAMISQNMKFVYDTIRLLFFFL